MRKPKQPGTKRSADEKPPAGGRAWQRVRQFALERGLPIPAKPSDDAAKSVATTKGVPRRIAAKSRKRAGTKHRG